MADEISRTTAMATTTMSTRYCVLLISDRRRQHRKSRTCDFFVSCISLGSSCSHSVIRIFKEFTLLVAMQCSRIKRETNQVNAHWTGSHQTILHWTWFASTDSMKHFTVSIRLAEFWIFALEFETGRQSVGLASAIRFDDIDWRKVSAPMLLAIIRWHYRRITPPYIPNQLSAHDVN